MKSFFQIILFCSIFSSSSFAAENKGEVRVAVASNFSSTLESISKHFTQSTGIKIIPSAGSSAKLFAQISNEGPFDLFLSADQDLPQKLIEKKLAVADSKFTYAIGSLVLWTSNPKTVKIKKALTDLHFKHLAIANPELAPYGLAAKEVLEKMDLWDRVKKQLVMGENVSQTYQFISTGNAEMGFVPHSQVIDVKVGSTWIIPQNLYSPILQDAVLLITEKPNPSALQFLNYLKGKEAQKIIAKSGYSLPEKND